LRSQIINLVLRGLVKRRLAACQTPADVRKVVGSLPTIAPLGVRFLSAAFGGITGEWAEAKKTSASLGTVLYLHGGGFAAMSPRAVRTITGGFALRGFRVFAPAYRLSPENRFPAALDDVTEAWRALRAEVEGPIFVAGESSGGGFAVALLLNLRDKKEQGPTAACLFSPWTDLAVTGASVENNRDRDPMESPGVLKMLAAAYAGEADLRSPLISPLYGDLVGLPPLAIFAGDTEILLDDARRLAERAQAAGVAVDLHVYPGMPHAWPLLSIVLPEGGKAMDEAASFMQAAAPRLLGDWLRMQRPLENDVTEALKKSVGA